MDKKYSRDTDRDIDLSSLGTFTGIPGIPVNASFQTIGLLVLGWLFSAVAARYGLDTSHLQALVTSTDADVHTRLTDAMANYEKYRAVVVGAMLIVINGGTAWTATRTSKDTAIIADATSRAMVAHTRALESENVLKTRSLELELENVKRGIPNSSIVTPEPQIPVVDSLEPPPPAPVPPVA